MISNRDANWRRYRSDFLKVNHCTVDQFEAAYIEFMKSHGNRPNAKAYRHFARKYGIVIFPEPNLPEDLCATLSVSIAAIKIMANTSEEAEAAVENILSIRH